MIISDAPSCVTLISQDFSPADIITLAVLLVVPVFAVTDSVSIPSPVPLDGDTVNQDVSSLEAVHDVFDVTVALVLPGDADWLHDIGDTISVADAFCVTVMALSIPPPAMVIVPVLLVVPIFSLADSVSIPLPVPLDDETVNQDISSLETVHDKFDVTITLVLPPDIGGFHDVGDTASIEAACVTVMVLVIPHTATVIVPVLLVVPVFAIAVNVSVPLLVPL